MKSVKLNFLLWFVLISGVAYAAPPNWAVNENAYEQVMTVTTFLNIDGQRLESPNDIVGAFVGNEVRGVGRPTTLVNGEGTYVAIFLIFSNTPGETINFKIYDSANDQVVDVAATVSFEIDASIGTRFQALSLANPVLNSESEIVDFGFSNVTEVKNTTINSNKITLEINDFEDVTNLQPVFTLSNGAQLFLGTNLQTSDSSTLDFTNEIVYSVRSQDQSQLTDWTIEVITTPQEIVKYFRRNAVCFLNGEIKVEFSIEGTEVTLMGDGIDTKVQPIFEGKTTFLDLPAGTYTVSLSSFTKQIEIVSN